MIATSGILVQLHYCGKQIESWAVNGQKKGCKSDPCHEEKEKGNSCCKDKIIALKIASKQLATGQVHFNFAQKLTFSETLLFPILSDITINRIERIDSYCANAPPGTWQYIPLYKLHSSFTYYG